MYQMSAMQEVTGFNNSAPQTDGETLTLNSLQSLERLYSGQYVSLLRLMLIFDESSRPTYVDMEQLFIEHEENAMRNVSSTKGKAEANSYILFYNQHYNTMLKKGPAYRNSSETELNVKVTENSNVKRGAGSFAST